MISLLATLTKLALLAVFTFFFVVLFQHGPQNFTQGIPTEWNSLMTFAKVKSDGMPPASTGTPAQTP